MNIEDIKKWGQDYTESPSDKAWDKITSKLDPPIHQEKNLWRANWHWFMAAASIIILMSLWGVRTDYLANKEIAYKFNINQSPIKMEELSYDSEVLQFYSISDIKTLESAYASRRF